MLTWMRTHRRQSRFARMIAANLVALWAVLAVNPCFAAFPAATPSANTPVHMSAAMPADMPNCEYAGAMPAQAMPDCDVFAILECELPQAFAAAHAGDPVPPFLPVMLYTAAPAARVMHDAAFPIETAAPPPSRTPTARLRHCVFLI